MLAYLLSNQPLPSWASGRQILAAGGQTGLPVDDLAAVTIDDAWLMGQAKTSLSVSGSQSSRLAESLEQVVDAYLGRLPDHPSTSSMRAIDPGRDLVVILADQASPGTVNEVLAKLMDRLRSYPSTLPLDQAATNAKQKDALAKVCAHLRRLWKKRTAVDLPEADLRGMLRLITVRALRLDGGEDYLDARAALREVVAESRLDELWNSLVTIAIDLNRGRGWVTRDGLVRRVELAGVPIQPLSVIRPAVERARRLSEANRISLGQATALKTSDGPVVLQRRVYDLVRESSGNLAVIGEAGAGKTVLLHTLACDMDAQNHDVVLLVAEDLEGALGEGTNLGRGLDEVLTGWPGMEPGFLLIDGLDQVRASDPSVWLAKLAASISATRWRIIATIREIDLRYSPRWRKVFAGPAIAPHSQALDLANVRHVLVGDLTDTEIDPLAKQSPALAQLLESADLRLRALLRNPFNLNLAASLLLAGSPTPFAAISSRAELLARYWQERVQGDSPTGTASISTLRAVVKAMLATRRQSVSPESLPAQVNEEALDRLLRDGVLRQSPSRPGHPTLQVTFTHPVFYDYAVAHLALGDTDNPESLLTVLDGDPDLVITARASIEYRLATIWLGDFTRAAFWDIALRLAARHVLAASAAAKQTAEQMTSEEDIKPLVDACGSRLTDPVGGWTITDARRLAFLTARYLSLAPRPGAMTSFASALARLARKARSGNDLELAGTCLQVAERATAVAPITASTPGLASWAAVARDTVALAVAVPAEANGTVVPGAGLRLLAAVAPFMPDTVHETVVACLQPSVVDEWGPGVLFPLADCFDVIGRAAPRLADAFARAIFGRTDSDAVPSLLLGNSTIFNMRSNRRQDLEGLQHAVARRYGPYLQAAPTAAVETFIAVADTPDPMAGIPSLIFERPPYLRFTRSMAFGGRDSDLLVMTNTVVRYLASETSHGFRPESDTEAEIISNDELRTCAELLLSRLANIEAWQVLLHAAARAPDPRLAESLYPALTAANLFTHPATRLLAAHVARRIIPDLSSPERDSILAAVTKVTSADPRAVTNSDIANDLRAASTEIRTALEAAVEHLPTTLPELPDSVWAQVVEWPPTPPATGSPENVDHRIQEGSRLLRESSPAEQDAARNILLPLWDDLADVARASTLYDRKIELASQLARLAMVTPGSAVGDAIYTALREALPPPDLVERQDDDSDLGSWDASPATRAVAGLVQLIWRPEWRSKFNNELIELLRPFLDCTNYGLRMCATPAIRLIYPAEELRDRIESRLRSDASVHVRTALLGQMWAMRARHSYWVDETIAMLADLPDWSFLRHPTDGETLSAQDRDLRELTIRILAALACKDSTPFATSSCETWLADPESYPHWGTLIVTTIRDAFNPADDDGLNTVQAEAFRLLKHAVAAAFKVAGDRPSNNPNRFKVATNIGFQLYVTSGAVDAQLHQQERTGSPDAFAAYALPLLNQLADIPDSRLAHNIIQTLDYLRDTQTAQVITIMAKAIAGNSAYTFESQGVDDIQSIVGHLITEHPAAVLSHSSGIAMIRSVLERFVANGWDKAMDLYDSLSDLTQTS